MGRFSREACAVDPATANGDLSCSVGYVFAAAIIALLGPVGATIAAIAVAMELYAQFDSLWYSDQSSAVLLGAGLLVDAAAYPFKPRAEKRGVVARVIGALYVVLGVGLSGSGLLLAGIVLNAFAFSPRVAG